MRVLAGLVFGLLLATPGFAQITANCAATSIKTVAELQKCTAELQKKLEQPIEQLEEGPEKPVPLVPAERSNEEVFPSSSKESKAQARARIAAEQARKEQEEKRAAEQAKQKEKEQAKFWRKIFRTKWQVPGLPCDQYFYKFNKKWGLKLAKAGALPATMPLNRWEGSITIHSQTSFSAITEIWPTMYNKQYASAGYPMLGRIEGSYKIYRNGAQIGYTHRILDMDTREWLSNRRVVYNQKRVTDTLFPCAS